MKSRRFLLALVIITMDVNSYGQLPSDVDEKYLLGKWTFQHGFTVENNDTIADPLFVKVYFDFKGNGLLTSKGSNDSLTWAVDCKNRRLLIGAMDSKGIKQTADYKMNIKNDSIFQASRSYNGSLFIYHFTKGWD